MMAKQDSKQKTDGAKSKGKVKFQEKIVRKEPPRLLRQYFEVFSK